jgi:hypothetical protein
MIQPHASTDPIDRVMGDSHYCPVCLQRVSAAQARRRAHREACRSGPLDVSLLQCPTCQTVLAAEIAPLASREQLEATA